MAQEYKTFDELPAGTPGQAGSVPAWQSGAKKFSFSAFFSGLFSLADASAWRTALGIADVMQFKGAIDASANPNYPAAAKGDVYKISVAGKIGGGSGAVVQASDTAYAIAANAGGTQASVGASWVIVQANIDGAVIGPASVTDGNPAVFDGTTGKLLKQLTYAAFRALLPFIGMRIYMSADQSPGAVGGTAQVINFDTTLYGAGLNASNHRWTPTVAGKYRVSLTVLFGTVAISADHLDIRIRKNGTIVALQASPSMTLSGFGGSYTVTDIVDMNGSTDYIDFAESSASGTTMTGVQQYTTFATADYLGP